MATPRTVRRAVLLSMLTVSIAVAVIALIDTHFNQIADWVSPPKDWVSFKVPDNARTIRALTVLDNNSLKICNQDGVNWSGVTVRLTGMYNAQYFAQTKGVTAGDCEHVPLSDFAQPSWKHIQMAPNESVKRIELLVSYDSSKGYSSSQ